MKRHIWTHTSSSSSSVWFWVVSGGICLSAVICPFPAAHPSPSLEPPPARHFLASDQSQRSAPSEAEHLLPIVAGD